MKVLVSPHKLAGNAGGRLDRLLSAGFELVYNETGRALSMDEIVNLGIDAGHILASGERYDESSLTRLPNLIHVARLGVGFDNVDLAACERRNIAVTVTPGTNQNAVADFAFGLLMSSGLNITSYASAVRGGTWKGTIHKAVYGKTLGIMGFGRIGRAVAARAAGFAMKVVYWDVNECGDGGIPGASYVPFETLLAQSDYISVHLPLNEETRGLLGNESFAKMKQGAVLINTARGDIVDEAALLDALVSGHLWAAASDVFEVEPPTNADLISHPNFIATPHTAAATDDAYELMTGMCVDQIIAVSEGRAVETGELLSRKQP